MVDYMTCYIVEYTSTVIMTCSDVIPCSPYDLMLLAAFSYSYIRLLKVAGFKKIKKKKEEEEEEEKKIKKKKKEKKKDVTL